MNLPDPPEFSPPASSTPLPPPPPPPPPVAPPLTSPLGSQPAGYVPYAASGVRRPTQGLGKATMIMYGVVSATALAVAGLIFHRKSVVQDIIDRGGRVTGTDAAADDRARSLLLAAAALSLIVLLAAAIVTAIWANRVAKNAAASGVPGISTGMAGGGWFIPIGMWFLGFRELRRAMEGFGQRTDNIRNWQIAFVLTSALGWLTRNIGGDPNSLRDLAHNLDIQFVAALFGFVLYVVATWLATRAIRQIDQTVSPT